MHYLFAEISPSYISDIYDYILIGESPELRLVNHLIKCGAQALKDVVGRTPLMCLTFNHFANAVQCVMPIYINYEADYYKIDRKIYENGFYELRSKGYESITDPWGVGLSRMVPIKNIFDKFWLNFDK